MHLKSLLKAYGTLGSQIPMWTQAQGSNLSFKDYLTKFLWIKPSGYRLDQVQKIQDLVEVDLQLLPKSWNDLNQTQYTEVIKKAKVKETSLRPSMETGFHAVLESTFVFHFHSLVAILMGAQTSGLEAWLKLKWTRGSVHCLDYQVPGLDLTREISLTPKGSLFLLNRHGVILAGEHESMVDDWFEIEKEWMREKYHAIWPLKESFEDLKIQFARGPLKILFPDMAVFINRIQNILVKDQDFWKLKSKIEKSETDLVELWVASQILHKYEPNLPELSAAEISLITGLPTEQYRLLMKK
jgi:ribulose-5-phosphate 4-epimerase/fuculose-1-phosphate aldolase